MENITIEDRARRREHMRIEWDVIHQQRALHARQHMPAPLGTLYQDRSHCYAVLCLFCRCYTVPLTASGRSATGNLLQAERSLKEAGWTLNGARWVCPKCGGRHE